MVVINGIKANLNDLQQLFIDVLTQKTKIIYIKKGKFFTNIITN